MIKELRSKVMLDTAIGPIVRVIDGNSFQMQVTHIGRHNKYAYGNYETVFIAPRAVGPNDARLSMAVIGRRVKCMVRYRDQYNRLFSDVEFENL